MSTAAVAHGKTLLTRQGRLTRPGRQGDNLDHCEHCAGMRVLAEGVGFEPTRERKPPGGFQDRCLKPLGHPSMFLTWLYIVD